MNSSNISSDHNSGYNSIGIKEQDQQNLNQEFKKIINCSKYLQNEDNLQESIPSFRHTQNQSPKNQTIDELNRLLNVEPKQKLIKSPLLDFSNSKLPYRKINLKDNYSDLTDNQFQQLIDQKEYYLDQLNEKDKQIQQFNQFYDQFYDPFYGQYDYNQGLEEDYKQSQAENSQLQSQLVKLQDKNSTLQNLNKTITINFEKITEQNRKLVNENKSLRYQLLTLKSQYGLEIDKDQI